MQPDSHRGQRLPPTEGVPSLPRIRNAFQDAAKAHREPPKDSTLTPETLVQLPQPGKYLPSPNGQVALTAVSQFNLKELKTEKSLVVIKISAESSQVSSGGQDAGGEWTQIEELELSNTEPHGGPRPASSVLLSGLAYVDFVWLDSATVMYLRPPGAKARTADLDPAKPDKAARKALEKRLECLDDEGKGVELWAKPLNPEDEEYKLGTLPVEVSDLKFQPIPIATAAVPEPREGLLAFSASVYAPYNANALFDVHKKAKEFEEKQQGSSGQTYSELFIRHWDQWKDQYGKAKRTFVARLVKSEEDVWSLDRGSIKAPASELNVECPVGPFGGSDDFDLGVETFAFTAKDPLVNPAWHTRQNIYVVALNPRNADQSKPQALTNDTQGATSSPALSPAAKTGKFGQGYLAYLEMRVDGYEADRNRVMVVDLTTKKRYGLTEEWDFSPSSVAWSGDGSVLYLTAEDAGHVKLFALEFSPGRTSATPKALTKNNTVAAFYPIPAPAGRVRLLLSCNSYATPNAPFVLSYNSASASSHTASLVPLYSLVAPFVDPLRMSSGESFWFAGANAHPVHGFLLRPPGYTEAMRADPKKRWPLAFLIHGGPQGAWTAGWSNRWNANAFAAQGYIVAAINPTGSTGYGQDFTDAIQRNWGGLPYQDLVAGYRYLLDTYEEIDPARTAALGASYGGYMVNWLMGHNPGFAVFVSHDGVFSTTGVFYNTEELYFPERDFQGTPYHVKAEYEKWNPQNHVDRWNTPCLVIHNRLDFRLPESEGIGVFNSLQRQGIPSKFLHFPDENHWVNKSPNRRRWYREVLAFLDQWVGEY